MFYQSEDATPMDQVQRQLLAVIGGEDTAELEQVVDGQLQVAEREIAEIPGRAEQNGAEFVQKVSEPMGQVIEALREYHGWLTQLKQNLNDHSALLAAHEQGQSVIPNVTRAFEEYSKAFAAEGSYRTPWANALSRIAAGISSGQASEGDWVQYLDHFHKAFKAKLDEISGVSLPGRGPTMEAYLHVVNEFAALHNVESFDGVEAYMQDLDQSIVRAQQLEGLMAQGIEGPAPIPATNVLLSVVRKGLAGEVDKVTVVSFVDDYRNLLDSFWEAFEKSMSRPIESVLVKDEIPRTLEYGDAHDAAAESLAVAYQSDDQAAVEKALEELLQSATSLEESREVFATSTQHQSAATCPACGRTNPPENRRCEACGQTLSTEGSLSSSFSIVSGPALEESQQLEMTENVAKLFTACDQVASGEITAKQFEGELANARHGLKDFAQDLDETAEQILDDSNMPEAMQAIWREEHVPYIQEVSATFTDGLAQCEEGLEEMSAFLHDSDTEHLVNGVRLVWEGLNVVHRARMAMNANLKMFEDVLEEAREAGAFEAVDS